MRNKNFIVGVSVVFCFLFSAFTCSAQSACPDVNAGSDVSICSGCATLSATVQGSVATTSYSVASVPYAGHYYFAGANPVSIGIDDHWSPVVTIPFCFSYYGNNYTQCVIGSNAVLSFNTGNAGAYNTWPIGAAIPSATPADLKNCIMAPWHDIDPSVYTYSTPVISWDVYGTSPCRAFVVSWNTCSMFDCNSEIATSQLVLYE